MVRNNPKLLSKDYVQERIIDFLAKNGWSKRLKAKGLKEHGVDIKVKNDKVARYFLVEYKGDASPKANTRALTGKCILTLLLDKLLPG